MTSRLTFEEETDRGLRVKHETGEPIASLVVKKWETDFLGRRFGLLTLDETLLTTLAPEESAALMDRITGFADENSFHTIEVTADISSLRFFPLLEDRGFRLVDTRISFVTLMKKKEIDHYLSDAGEIRLATTRDLPAILALTRASFVENQAFFSRFKNRQFYSEKETNAYFAAWIENHIETENVYFCVLLFGNQVAGYFFYKKSGQHKGKPMYKGILTAVHPDHAGHNAQLAMQSFLYAHFPDDEFYLDNTTQLTNVKVIRNHMKSQKRLKKIELVFYRKKT